MRAEIRVRGKAVSVPASQIDDRTIIALGKWLKEASVMDEDLIEGEAFANPEVAIATLKHAKFKADLLTFAQKVPHTTPRHSYYLEWDSAAVIPITSYEDWFAKRAATDVRQNVRKSSKRGVVVRRVPFDDILVKGIVDIYNESPIRQGKPFWHYGKDFATVKRETGHCLDRSIYIGAYHRDELIGFIKLLRTGPVADIVLIVSKQCHRDRKPTNALIGKAVEICVQEEISYLSYAKFTYGKKSSSSLAEFKRHNGFEEMLLPRYYVPLTQKGRVAIALKLHHGLQGVIPEAVLGVLRRLRANLYSRTLWFRHQLKGSQTARA